MSIDDHQPSDAVARKPVVLVIDAQPASCSYFQKYLGDQVEVIVVGDVPHAVQELADHDLSVAVVIYDLRLTVPEIDRLMTDWLTELYPTVLRVASIMAEDMDAAICQVTDRRIFRFLERPWDVPMLCMTVREGIEAHKRQSARLGEGTPTANLALTASGRLPAVPPTAAAELPSTVNDKRQVTFRIVKVYMKALRREALANKFDSYSPYLEHILRQAFKTLRKTSVSAEERTRMYKRHKKITVTFYLSHSLVRTYHVLANQLGYANTSELVNEILEKNVVPVDDDESHG